MALPPIQVQLSKFEQIEILRAEIELREQELRQTEKQIRDLLFESERQKYLRSVHPIFNQLPAPESAAHLPQLNANRDALGEALEAMRSSLAKAEAETAGQTAPPSRNPAAGLPRPAQPRAARFDSFDQFRANKSNG